MFDNLGKDFFNRTSLEERLVYSNFRLGSVPPGFRVQDISLGEALKRDSWPFNVNLPCGICMEIRKADNYRDWLKHFVTVIPEAYLPISDTASSEFHQATEIYAKQLSEQVFEGNPGHYHIDFNGSMVASMPSIPHIHIYLFGSLEEKRVGLRRLLLGETERKE